MHRRERKGVWLSSLAERRGVLHQLQERRQQVLNQLNALLEQQQLVEQQGAQLSAASQELERLTATAQHRRQELAKVREVADAKCHANQARRVATSGKAAQLATARISVAPLVLPQELRTHEMAVLHAWLGLLSEQRHKMSQLLEILPLRVEGLRSGPAPTSITLLTPHVTPGTSPTSSSVPSSGPPSYSAPHHMPIPNQAAGITVSLCGTRLPDSLDGAHRTQALCAVLGYAVLLLDLAAAYLGSPLLHEGSFQGSTSVVWHAQTFWNRKPPGANGVLPLFMDQGLVAAAVAPLSLNAGKSKSSSGSGWGGLPLMRAITNPSQPALAQGTLAAGPAAQEGGSLHGSASSRAPGEDKYADFLFAFQLLQRSCMCLVRHCAMGVAPVRAEPAMDPAEGGYPAGSAGVSPTSHLFPVRGPSWGSSLWPQHAQHTAGWPGGGSNGSQLGRDGPGRPRGGYTQGPGLPLPFSWSAWGCLAVLCAALLQEDVDAPHPSSPAAKLWGVLPSATTAVHAEACLTPAAWQPTVVAGMLGSPEEAADEEGWDVVHKVLPPPPSSDDQDVEQYARAMFSDGNTASFTSGPQASGGSVPQVSALTRALSLSRAGRGSSVTTSASSSSMTAGNGGGGGSGGGGGGGGGDRGGLPPPIPLGSAASGAPSGGGGGGGLPPPAPMHHATSHTSMSSSPSNVSASPLGLARLGSLLNRLPLPKPQQ